MYTMGYYSAVKKKEILLYRSIYLSRYKEQIGGCQRQGRGLWVWEISQLGFFHLNNIIKIKDIKNFVIKQKIIKQARKILFVHAMKSC